MAQTLKGEHEGAEARPAILIVDDRPEQRLSLAALLQDLAEEIVVMSSGRDALRCLLQREFAVILLDVNMPDCDGFETASLIRQRKSSRATPIIFVTAYADDAHAARGYSLGAVDFIMTPVDPQVLRTKVSVFLELYRRTEEVRRQARSLRDHADQLRRLAGAATAIHGATSLDDLLKIVADTAASILGAAQVAVEIDAATLSEGSRAPAARSGGAFWKPERTSLGALARGALPHMEARSVRFTRAELDENPRWGKLAASEAFLPLQGWLAAPLETRDSRLLGWIQLSEKHGGDFTAEDEIVLSQLAHMASIAAENTLVAEVREANRLKDQFLATLSHELRTPLQSILTWSQLLREDAAEGSMLLRGLEVIDRNARSQTRLIEDLLDVSRIISGKLVLEREPLRLSRTPRRRRGTRRSRSRWSAAATPGCSATPNASARSSATCSRMPSSSRRRAEACCSRSRRTRVRSRSRCATRESGSRRSSFRTSSSAFGRPTAERRARRGGWASASPSRGS
jgi:CheY-like chemotaxis protein